MNELSEILQNVFSAKIVKVELSFVLFVIDSYKFSELLPIISNINTNSLLPPIKLYYLGNERNKKIYKLYFKEETEFDMAKLLELIKENPIVKK